MTEQDISDIAEIIPEVMMANRVGYKAGLVYGFLWGLVVSSLAFVGLVSYAISQGVR